MSEDSRQLEAFRAEVSAWMEANKPEDPGFLLPLSFLEVGSDEQLEFLQAWQRKVYEAGYLGMAWPEAYGGRGMPAVYQQVADEEMNRHRVPIMFNVIGLGWAGPLILAIGSEDEKQRYIRGILTGEDIWCQGFSEPDHGSDLGAVQTRAVRDGDEYIINGSKIWTTLGDKARYMILLARTDPDAPSKYAGLSFFLAPMQVPGIDTTPIRKLSGECGFAQCFFTDARIPASCLMGEEGQGWQIAMQTLLYERGAEAGAAGGPKFVPVVMDDLLAMAARLQRDGEPLLADPVVRDELVQLLIEEQSLRLNQARASIPALNTDYPGALALSSKLSWSEYARRMRLFAIGLQGAAGSLYVGDAGALDGGLWQRAYFNSFGATIGGGTSEIQHNIVAEHVLGLPKG